MDASNVALREILAKRFTTEELRSLCHRLGISDDELAATTRNAMARELVEYLHRRNRLAELPDAIRAERPDVYHDLPPLNLPPPRSPVLAPPPAGASPAPPSTSRTWQIVAVAAIAVAVVAVVLLLSRPDGPGTPAAPTASTAETPAGTVAPQPPAPTNDSSAPTTYRYGGGDWPAWQTTFTTNDAEARTAPSGDEFCIDVLNPGQDTWDIEVGPSPLLFASNRSYTLRVTARATATRIARVHMKYAPGVDIALDREDSMVIGPQSSTHEFGFTLKTDEPITSAYVSVLVGGKDQGLGTVCLSSVEIVPR